MIYRFRNKIYQYLTHQYILEQVSYDERNYPYFMSDVNYENFLFNYLIYNLEIESSSELEIVNCIQAKTSENTGYNYQAIWGHYGSDLDNTFICVVDDKFNPIQLFKTYDSGTPIQYIRDLQVAEDGTLYSVEETTENSFRFAMYNNIFVSINGSYKLTLRYTASIPLNNVKIDNVICPPCLIKKKYEEAKYFVGLYGQAGGMSRYELGVLEIEINVGSANEFTNFNYGQVSESKILDLVIGVEGDKDAFKLMTRDYVNDEFDIFKGVEETSGLVKSAYQTTGREVGDALFLNYETAYIISSNWLIDTQTTLYLDKITTSLTNVYELKINKFEVPSNMNLKYTDGDLFFYFAVSGEEEGFLQINYGRIANDKMYYQVQTEELLGDTDIVFSVSRVFDLYNVYFYNINNVYIHQQIYNVANYNGIYEWQDWTSLVPNDMYLESDLIVFARRLYSLSYFQNYITSTIQVPNVYLNYNTINYNNLRGKTANSILSNSQNWQKNIYEEVYVNSIQEFRVVNKLNGSTEINNNAGVNLVSALHFAETNYENIYVKTYKITYTNSEVVEGELSKFSEEFNNEKITYSFTFGSRNGVKSIEILSGDGNTKYANVNTSGIENNKIYTIKFDMKVLES